jgi:TPP-dependent trihydroxycyclohexane-1,2-dione (THcHDO) dehydratase
MTPPTTGLVAGSMPVDLHELCRTRDPKGYHVEYRYSCMGYEIAGGLGASTAPARRAPATSRTSAPSAST